MSATELSDGPIGPGIMAAIVGPSGAGKDTVIAALRARCETDNSIVFARRCITRKPDMTELHEELSDDAFRTRLETGGFALHWRAHDLSYAVPAGIDMDIRAGRTVVANISRAVIPAARSRYAHCAVILVDAPIAVRTQRLASRGRETETELLERLQRAVSQFSNADADLVVDNSGELDNAVAQLLGWLRQR